MNGMGVDSSMREELFRAASDPNMAEILKRRAFDQALDDLCARAGEVDFGPPKVLDEDEVRRRIREEYGK